MTDYPTPSSPNVWPMPTATGKGSASLGPDILARAPQNGRTLAALPNHAIRGWCVLSQTANRVTRARLLKIAPTTVLRPSSTPPFHQIFTTGWHDDTLPASIHIHASEITRLVPLAIRRHPRCRYSNHLSGMPENPPRARLLRSLHRPITANQGIGGAIMGQRRFAGAFQFRHDALSEHLA